MENSVTPFKPVTEEQIGKFNQNFTARLLKHKAEIPSDVFQDILGDKTLIDEMHLLVRKRVEARTGLIVRTVKVKRNRSPKEAIKATGRNEYLNDDVVAEMPKGEGEETEVFFFNLGRQVNDADLEKEYELRGLVPADAYSLLAVNEEDPAFADEHPNGTHWKNKQGKWCFAYCDRWCGKRDVDVIQDDRGWADRWWFAGVRKKTTEESAA